MVHFYRTDFGDVVLTDAFVEEADARWPDARCTRTPRWVDKVHGAITQLVIAAQAKNTRVRVIKSLAALEAR